MTGREQPKMKEYYRVYADIDLDAIYENVKNAKALLKKDTKMMAIVKADGYGHGAVEVARQIDELVDAYGVAILEEGIELRKAGFTKPILILGYTPKPLYPAMIRYDIATAVFTMEMAKEISDTAVAMHKNCKHSYQIRYRDEPDRFCHHKGKQRDNRADREASGH